MECSDKNDRIDTYGSKPTQSINMEMHHCFPSDSPTLEFSQNKNIASISSSEERSTKK